MLTLTFVNSQVFFEVTIAGQDFLTEWTSDQLQRIPFLLGFGFRIQRITVLHDITQRVAVVVG